MNQYFDRKEELIISTSGNLPHWHQEGKIQFVTFRLFDSLPQSRLEELKLMIAKFKSNHPEPWDAETKRSYRHLVGPAEERLLDNGYGCCVLRNPATSQILIDIIDSCRFSLCDILSYVIMPNHVHMLILPRPEVRLHTVTSRIKGASARLINESIGRSGALWMKESFDHIVRSESQLKYYLAYIKHNPKHLPESSASLYENRALISTILST